MGMDDTPQLEDLLKEYVAFADKRAQEKLEKERVEAERLRQEKEGKIRTYETAKAELATVLDATANGSYSQPLTRILKDIPTKSMDIGIITREQQLAPATNTTYNKKYGIRLNNQTEGKGPIIFYAGESSCCTKDMCILELLEYVTVCGSDHPPKLLLTAEQHKNNLTNAVAGALKELKKSEGAQ